MATPDGSATYCLTESGPGGNEMQWHSELRSSEDESLPVESSSSWADCVMNEGGSLIFSNNIGSFSSSDSTRNGCDAPQEPSTEASVDKLLSERTQTLLP